MSEEIGKLYKKLATEVSTMTNSIKDKQKLMDALRKECTHNWKFDYTCGHKREDHYICVWCGKGD